MTLTTKLVDWAKNHDRFLSLALKVLLTPASSAPVFSGEEGGRMISHRVRWGHRMLQSFVFLQCIQNLFKPVMGHKRTHIKVFISCPSSPVFPWWWAWLYFYCFLFIEIRGKVYIKNLYVLGPDSVSTKPLKPWGTLVLVKSWSTYLNANMQSYPFHSVLTLEPLASGHRHAVAFQSCPHSGNEWMNK